jgi:hypothetical protein
MDHLAEANGGRGVQGIAGLVKGETQIGQGGDVGTAVGAGWWPWGSRRRRRDDADRSPLHPAGCADGDTVGQARQQQQNSRLGRIVNLIDVFHFS